MNLLKRIVNFHECGLNSRNSIDLSIEINCIEQEEGASTFQKERNLRLCSLEEGFETLSDVVVLSISNYLFILNHLSIWQYFIKLVESKYVPEKHITKKFGKIITTYHIDLRYPFQDLH